ncbi:porin [Novispirillum itersonii]|uniref:Putative porin n=1 Tax=Novispirillum itersonii TaxID=189 RepID=A0A7W9ZDL1_NOVIT|nr:porin [Novispirillum itersonii]MBB6209233.1 putative porin [Novispirillum itersonii]
MTKTFALLGTTALATTLIAGSAFAADPIKLSVGGYGAVMVGYASNDDAFIRQSGREVSAVDVKGDNEIHFKGSTTLDNGLTVAVVYEIESGGRSMADVSDEYSITLSGKFGAIKAGADDNALAMIHSNAPRVGGRLFDGGAVGGDVMVGNYVVKPTNFDDSFFGDTAIDTNGDAESVSYISPSVAGFTFGASYVPNVSAGDDQPGNTLTNNTQVSDAYGAGIGYKGEIGAVSVAADIGWLTADTGNDINNHNEYQAGLNVGYAGFTVGGAYRAVRRDASAVNARDPNANLWEIGASYETGPYGVSLVYISGNQKKTTNIADDKIRSAELAGEYKMGPGVSLVGGIAYVSFDGEGTAATGADNKGWVAATGLSLTF